jgi:hypothetical protein
MHIIMGVWPHNGCPHLLIPSVKIWGLWAPVSIARTRETLGHAGGGESA